MTLWISAFKEGQVQYFKFVIFKSGSVFVVQNLKFDVSSLTVTFDFECKCNDLQNIQSVSLHTNTLEEPDTGDRKLKSNNKPITGIRNAECLWSIF